MTSNPLMNTIDIDNDLFGEDTTDTLCPICNDKLEENYPEKITLKCNHAFCYECLLESYRGAKCNFTSGRPHRICPYCRTPASYLPLLDGMTPLKGIHREYGKKSVKKVLPVNQCKAIIKTGVNAGKQCTCKAKLSGDYCGRHMPKNN